MKKAFKTFMIILFAMILTSLIALSAFAFNDSSGPDDDPMTAPHPVPEITDNTGGSCGKDPYGSNVTWKLSKIGVLTINGSGAMAEFELGAPWYPYAPKIKAVVFEGGSSVTNISDMAFYGLTGITAFIVPKSVETIGSAAFAGCSSLLSVSLPDGLRSIGDNAFYYCQALEKIVIPDTVTVISDYTFAGCEVLSSVALSKNLTHIGDNAFGNCRKLRAINIPEGVEYIGENAFGICVALREIKLPESLKTLGSYAFGGCTSLRDFNLPKSVTKLGDNPLTGCKSISYITVDKENPMYCSIGGVLYNKDMTRLISYPPAKPGAGYNIPETVTDIGSDAFYGCRYITSMVIPENVRTIGDSAFYGSKALRSITIMPTVEKIGYYAFEGFKDSEGDEIIVNIIGCNGSAAYKYASKNNKLFTGVIDLNGNQRQDAGDALILLDHITGRNELTGELLIIADGNVDGSVDIRDFNRLYADINK